MQVRLDDVSHEYGASEEAAPVRVLEHVTLRIESGDLAILRGESGSGKSTLLNVIGAVDRPTSGRVFLGDVETTALRESGLTLLRRHSIGFIFQFFNLVPTLDVAENVGFPLALAGTGKAETAARVAAVLARVGLAHRARHFPNELSGGEMQRVAIGRAIIHKPSIILADEPTGNLDSKSGTAVLELIRQLHDETGATVIMATHSETAAAYGDYSIEVADGRVRSGAARG